jgi:hypothetical protein
MDATRRFVGATLTTVVVVAGLAIPASANAAGAITTGTRVVYASDDTYTSSTWKNTNYGFADRLAVGTSAGQTRVSYVKFGTGALPAGTTLAGVQLKLPIEGRPVAGTLRLYLITADWSEKAVTAMKAPAMSAAMVSITPKTTNTELIFDVSKWVTKPGVYAFALKSASTTTAVTWLRSVEYGDDSSGGPELDLSYTGSATATVETAPAAPSAAAGCVTGALLVPSCGVLWGAAAGGFTDGPRDQALIDWERITGRTATIYHAYHRGNELFPNKAEIAMADDPAHPRVLMINWKVAYNTTWAKVAAGSQDARIDDWARYVKANYTKKFFLVLHHEPENDVKTAAGSGMTAKDYAAMYRHVTLRLRADGVTNAISVLAYMGNEKWMSQSWWKDIYPGDDVVDWIATDSYVSVEKGYYHYGDFGDLIDRQPTGGGLGWYDWAARNHPGKPLMVAEWGMYHRVKDPIDKSAAFNTVIPELKLHPKIKAVVYFDTASDDEGDRDISVNSTPSSLTTFRKIAADPMFKVTLDQ